MDTDCRVFPCLDRIMETDTETNYPLPRTSVQERITMVSEYDVVLGRGK